MGDAKTTIEIVDAVIAHVAGAEIESPVPVVVEPVFVVGHFRCRAEPAVPVTLVLRWFRFGGQPRVRGGGRSRVGVDGVQLAELACRYQLGCEEGVANAPPHCRYLTSNRGVGTDKIMPTRCLR